jgi:hypothetical protein
MAKHFKIGGSTAKRTLRCPAWVSEAAKLPPVNRTSAAAERGTAMHEVLELALNGKSLGFAMSEVNYTFDDFDRNQMISAYQAIEILWEKYQIEEFETEPLLSVAEDVGGSPDVVAAGNGWTLVADFKFGRHPVDPVNNAQILFYHWLACQDDTVKDLTEGRALVGAIIQPAVSSEPQIYEFNEEEVAIFDHDIREAIRLVRLGETAPTPGEHCEWCPAEPYCSARRKQMMSMDLLSHENAESLASALDLLPMLESFIKATKEEATRVMQELGSEVPGYKLVAKKENRKFADPFKTAAALTSAGVKDIYSPPSLKTPAQLEKVLKAEGLEFDFTSWLKAPSGETEIAPNSDKRAAVIVQQKKIGDILKRNLEDKI